MPPETLLTETLLASVAGVCVYLALVGPKLALRSVTDRGTIGVSVRNTVPAFLVTGALPVTALFTGLVLGSPALAWIGSSALVLGPRLVGSTRLRRREAKRVAAVPEIVDLVAHRVRSGGSLPAAVRATFADQATFVTEFEPILRDVDGGERLERALLQHAGRQRWEETRLLLTTCAVLIRTGGPAADALERLADRLRSATAATAEAQAQSGQQLASASVMAVLPLGFAALFALTDQRAAALYLRTGFGAACLGLSLALSVAGWAWMQRVLQAGGGT